MSARVTQRSAAQVASVGGTALLVCVGVGWRGEIKKKTKEKKNLHKMEHWLSSAQVRKARNIKGEEEEGG